MGQYFDLEDETNIFITKIHFLLSCKISLSNEITILQTAIAFEENVNRCTSLLDKRVEPLYNQTSTLGGLTTRYFCHGFRTLRDDAKFITNSYLLKKKHNTVLSQSFDVQLR